MRNFMLFPKYHKRFTIISFGGIHSIMVIIIGNGISDPSSNSLTKLFVFHFTRMPWEKARIQLFSHKLWINSWTDKVLLP